MNSMLEEAYTNLKMVCLDMMGVHDLKLKVDTGTSDNTIPTRTARDMYGKSMAIQSRTGKTHKAEGL